MGEPTQEQISAGMRVLLEYYPDARESRSAIYGIYRAMEAVKPKPDTRDFDNFIRDGIPRSEGKVG